MEDVSISALRAASDPALREKFIQDNIQTILRIASRVTGRYVTVSDDEWSVALYAFNRSIDTYTASKGEFISYANTVIKNALIDHHRSEAKYSSEIAYAPEILAGEGDVEVTDAEVFRAVAGASVDVHEAVTRKSDIRDEITEINDRLTKYGFTFYDIADCSPKAGKTKRECARVISYIIDHYDMMEAVETTGKIPAAKLHADIGVSTKLLDRYRRYIIMAVIVLNGEYPLLADYLEYVRKEGG